MQTKIKHYITALILAVLVTNGIYTLLYRFTEPHPATRWLPLYDWLYRP